MRSRIDWALAGAFHYRTSHIHLKVMDMDCCQTERLDFGLHSAVY